MGEHVQSEQTSRRARAELSKIMQRLFWCSLLMMVFGFASSLPAQERAPIVGTAMQNTAVKNIKGEIPEEDNVATTAPECISSQQLKALADSFPRQPAEALPDIESLGQAYCIQARYVAALSEKLAGNGAGKGRESGRGKAVGYKVGFTGEAGQKKFAISHPAVGVILRDMLVESGSTLPANFAWRGLVEPDVLVTVKSNAIMNATTIEEVALHLDKLHAFLELPSVRLAKDRKVTAKELIALDIGATKMVVGEAIAVQSTPEFLNLVQQAQTVFVDKSGNMLQQAPMSNLMGHPFNAVLWLITQLQQQGKSLQQGDYISLGAVGKLFPVSAEPQSYVYTIAFGNKVNIEASVNFVAGE